MIRQIAVIGTGTMGRGIAYLAAVAGYDTVIHDADAAALDAARAAVESTLRKATEKGKVADADAAAAMERPQTAADLEPAARQADLIIEAVPENPDLKKNIFGQADLFCDEETILAANTSSISISELSGAVERRDRFVGVHFVNRPRAMKLLEIGRWASVTSAPCAGGSTTCWSDIPPRRRRTSTWLAAPGWPCATSRGAASSPPASTSPCRCCTWRAAAHCAWSPPTRAHCRWPAASRA